MGLLLIATLPARTAIAGAELIIAVGRMVARDGPVRRTGGYEERTRVLRATGGAIEPLGRLGDPDGPLARIEELGPLNRLMAEGGIVDRQLAQLGRPGENLEELVALKQTLRPLARLAERLPGRDRRAG